MQDRCINRLQKTRHTHPACEPRDQQKRKDHLPQFSSRHNKCLQCAGDHHTTNCTRQQSSSTNTSTTGTGIPPHQHAPITSCTSVHTNSQSPTTNSESTLHVRTPTLNINAPSFPPNLHQAPLPPHAQNRPNNFYTNPQQTHTPSHTFNTQLPPPFNPHVPPPYFPQYPAPLVHLLIVVILQSYWLYKSNGNAKKNWIWSVTRWKKKKKKEKG